jgi:hypothetical protein
MSLLAFAEMASKAWFLQWRCGQCKVRSTLSEQSEQREQREQSAKQAERFEMDVNAQVAFWSRDRKQQTRSASGVTLTSLIDEVRSERGQEVACWATKTKNRLHKHVSLSVDSPVTNCLCAKHSISEQCRARTKQDYKSERWRKR